MRERECYCQNGFSLVEVLVAMVVLSVVLLGLITTAAKNTQSIVSSDQSVLATMYAADITNRMQANPIGVQGNHYAKTPKETLACYQPAGCDPELMARMDLFEWQKNVAEHLPSGTVEVCLDETPNDGEPGSPMCSLTGGKHVVKIWWREDGATEYQKTIFTFEVEK
ncbi:MAG: type IV pilus modification protein PilV [Gammaproteobacteria bacterium]